MEIPVIVEPFGGGWRARCRHPVEASVTGDTRHEALQALEAILRAAITSQFTLLPLEVTPDKPWIASAGAIPDDATPAEWLAAIEDYRRQRDADDQASISPPPSQPVPYLRIARPVLTIGANLTGLSLVHIVDVSSEPSLLYGRSHAR
ncbi:MAG: hypothetical protein L0241_14220 [Planctomycetia bacterium]|nr:hypothetical protein [Planctomycetia bacterium]